MNILFLTMVSGLKNIETSGIYTDLMRKFRDKGNEVYIIYPRERRLGLPTEVSHKGKVHLLGVKTLNLTKTNLIEKGLGQVMLERQFKSALEKHFGKVKFDVILYSTPPITFTKVIRYVKRQIEGYLSSKCCGFGDVNQGWLERIPLSVISGKGKRFISDL